MHSKFNFFYFIKKLDQSRIFTYLFLPVASVLCDHNHNYFIETMNVTDLFTYIYVDIDFMKHIHL